MLLNHHLGRTRYLSGHWLLTLADRCLEPSYDGVHSAHLNGHRRVSNGRLGQVNQEGNRYGQFAQRKPLINAIRAHDEYREQIRDYQNERAAGEARVSHNYTRFNVPKVFRQENTQIAAKRPKCVENGQSLVGLHGKAMLEHKRIGRRSMWLQI